MVRYRILIGDDDAYVHELLTALLSTEYELIEPASNGRDLVDGASRHNPDVVIADISMPVLNGFEAVRQIRLNGVISKFVFFTTHNNHAYVRHALASGASGYVLKEVGGEDLPLAVREVLLGRVFVSPRIGYALRP